VRGITGEILGAPNGRAWGEVLYRGERFNLFLATVDRRFESDFAGPPKFPLSDEGEIALTSGSGLPGSFRRSFRSRG
jgi:hypothetical protein